MGHISTAVVREAGTSTFYNAVETEGHTFVMDEPESMGGTNIGPAPFSLIAAALGACTNMTLRMYADLKQLPLDEVDTEVTHSPSAEGHHFQRIITLTGVLTDTQKQRLLEIANKCPVHQLLVSGAAVTSELSGEVA
jgi:putative redox protein